MSFIEIVNTLRTLGVDVLLLALGVMFIVSLLKKTVMKNVPKKLFIFLPFVVGIALYAIFRALVTMSPAPFTSDIVQTLKGGFACGCSATLYFVLYEHLVSGKEVSPFYPLLEGLVPEKKRKEAANTLYKGCKDLPGDACKTYLMEHLNTYCEPPMSEEELSEIASILTEFLSSVEKK